MKCSLWWLECFFVLYLKAWVLFLLPCFPLCRRRTGKKSLTVNKPIWRFSVVIHPSLSKDYNLAFSSRKSSNKWSWASLSCERNWRSLNVNFFAKPLSDVISEKHDREKHFSRKFPKTFQTMRNIKLFILLVKLLAGTKSFEEKKSQKIDKSGNSNFQIAKRHDFNARNEPLRRATTFINRK